MKLTFLLIAIFSCFTSFAMAQDKPWRITPAGEYAFELFKGDQVAARFKTVHWGPDWKWYDFPKDIKVNPDDSQSARVSANIGGTDISNTLDFKFEMKGETARLSYEFIAGQATPVVGSIVEIVPDANFFAGGRVNFKQATGGTDTRDWPLGTTDDLGPYARIEFVSPNGDSFNIDLDPATIVSGFNDGVRIFIAKNDLVEGSNGIKMLNITVGGDSRFAPKAAAIETDLSTWFAYPIDRFGPPIDLSFLNKDAAGKVIPAGSRGFLKVEGEHFVFPDGTRQKFWGVNVTAMALTDSKIRGKQIAERLSKMGVNLVRLHHMDSWHKPVVDGAHRDGTTQNLNNETLETIDAFIAELSARGIYVKPDVWVQRFFRQNDGVAAWENFKTRSNHDLHPYVFFDPRMQELIRKQVIGVMGHVGKTTGKSMFDNPAIAFFQPANEALMQRGGGHVKLEPYKTNFVQLFRDWQSSKGLAGEGDPIENNYSPEHQKFYIDLMRKFYDGMNAEYRKAGAKVPMGSSNWMVWAWEFRSQLTGDFMDAHHYYGGDRIGPGGELGRLWTLDAPGRTQGPFGPIAASRAVGKPFMISEVGDNPPKTFRAAFPIGLAAVASLQDWDAVMGYAYSQREKSFAALDPFEWEGDPVTVASWSAAALLFRRGDIQPGKERFTMHITGDEQYAMHWEADNKKMYYNTPQFNQLLETSRVNVWQEDDGPIPDGGGTVITPEQARSFASINPIVSDTGELRRDFEKGIGSMSTPKTVGAYGMIGGAAVETDSATFNITTPFAVAVLSSLDDQPIASSGKMLLITAARAQNTGRQVNVTARRVTEEGRAPVICEPVVGTIAIKTTMPALSLVAINADGTKQKPRPFNNVDGVVTLILQASDKTLFYEVVQQ